MNFCERRTPSKRFQAKNLKNNSQISVQGNNENQCPNTYHKKMISIQKNEKQWKVQDFQIIKIMGKGKFGQVMAAKQKDTDFMVALKRMSKKQLQEEKFNEQVKREIIIQSSLNHQNIVKLFGYFWDQKYIYLVLEYAPGGQLYKLIKNHPLTEKQTSIVIRQVCQGLKYLHSKNIIHRDLKPQNLLLSVENVKIADFGWSIHSINKRQTFCGTLDYLAPEMVKGSNYDSKIDIWGLGVLAYELSVGNPPFEKRSYKQTYQQIVKYEVQFPSHVSLDLRNLIKKCLHKDPQKRIGIDQVMNEKFIIKFMNQKLSI